VKLSDASDDWKIVGFLILFAASLVILGSWLAPYIASRPPGL
jgi:hypothetical protein